MAPTAHLELLAKLYDLNRKLPDHPLITCDLPPAPITEVLAEQEVLQQRPVGLTVDWAIVEPLDDEFYERHYQLVIEEVPKICRC
ncbi:unnamed protein product [Haemonchus placei]|uniref:DUF5753 domain-containing protein n=1 Tax=Haemonchus placei TaxID=6290 RepID=A0A0N4WBS1_HAEPC|nr:unnamed protein product [Haemonchus placei]